MARSTDGLIASRGSCRRRRPAMQRRESDLLDRVDARFRHVERGARASFDDPSCVAIGRAAPTLRSGRQGGLKAIGLAAVLMVVGTASAELAGYGGLKEVATGLGILLLSLVLYGIRRLQDRHPAPGALSR